MIIDRFATLITALQESLIPTLLVESLTMINTIVVGSTQLVDIKIHIMADTSIVPPISITL